MSWLILVLSGLFEAVWATALSKADGFTRPIPSLVFLVSVLISMGGLGIAMRNIPVGTAYAVWAGIGAGTTAGFAMLTGAEPVSVARIVLIAGLIGCIVGLKLVH